MLCPESGNTNSVTKNDVGVQCDLRQGVEDGLHESVCVCVSEALNEDANSCEFMFRHKRHQRHFHSDLSF